MKVKVLGCSGAVAKGFETTAFLVEDQLLVDAGTGISNLSVDAMQAVTTVVLTHAHLDHIAGLPLFIDARGIGQGQVLHAFGLDHTLCALREHIFNDKIWPNFARLPSPDKPSLVWHAIEKEAHFHCGELEIQLMPADHLVPTAGYAIRKAGEPWCVWTGDTAFCERFWRQLNTMNVGALIVESAFSDEEKRLAKMSLHMCPSELARGLSLLNPAHAFPIWITHIKPTQIEVVMQQIQTQVQVLKLPNPLKALLTQQEIVV